jgi:hypothetical protein
VNSYNPYLDCIWIYLFAPFAGAILAASLSKYHLDTAAKVEEELDMKHRMKLD